MNVISELDKFEYVIIYGAGLYGRTFLEWIKGNSRLKNKKVFLAVTEKNEYEIYDEEIYSIRDLKKYIDSATVVIAVSEEKQGEMIEVIEKLSFEKYITISKQFFEYIRVEANFFAGKALELAEKSLDYSREILWGMNFDRAIAQCDWLIRKDFKTNWSAVGNYYLYILYKALDSGRFQSVLDIGMGQTTKLITQYVRKYSDVRHIVVENSREWIDFSKEDLDICNKTDILYMETGWGGSGGNCRVYSGFKDNLKDMKFDLISVDGPQGYDMKHESRIDILDIVPECLCDSWIILMDDVGREGERNTFLRMLDKLGKYSIKYNYAMYTGTNQFAICTSEDNRFFCTI